MLFHTIDKFATKTIQATELLNLFQLIHSETTRLKLKISSEKYERGYGTS